MPSVAPLTIRLESEENATELTPDPCSVPFATGPAERLSAFQRWTTPPTRGLFEPVAIRLPLGENATLDVGLTWYMYPSGADETDFAEPYVKLSSQFGPVKGLVGVAYAPEQDSLGGTDNLYVYSDVGVGIPNTPVTLTGHLGYTDGFLTFTDDGDAFDWSIGAEANIYGPLTLSAAYVGAEGDIAPGAYDFVDDAFVVTLSASF